MSVAGFFKDLLVLTLSQIISLFAGIFIFGLLIHFLSHFMFNSLGRAFGPAGTYLVAWLGTPIHELGHVIFCIIFGHKITKVELFSPDPQSGTLGYVNHEWKKSNPWQVLGNFFIGIGPIIVGSLALLGLFYLLAPNGSRAWDSIIAGANQLGGDKTVAGYLAVLKDSFLVFVKAVFTVANISSWQFWVFCYLAICVASNIRLSLADMKNSMSGLGCLVIPFIIVNIIALLSGIGSERYFPFTASTLSVMYSLFILALFLTAGGFIITYLISAIVVKLWRGKILNPF
ncbi:MAG TPA: hypothetical protein G4O16_09470 [Dehalococcoidia bacterium]|nr:hypothetical protein [Dehalococcoidia bacterium]